MKKIAYLRDTGDDIGSTATQSLHILHELLLILTSKFGEGDSSLVRSTDQKKPKSLPVDNLIVNIGNVHHKHHVIVEVITEHTHNDVLAQIRSRRNLQDVALTWHDPYGRHHKQ